jgi:hypothetical protein
MFNSASDRSSVWTMFAVVLAAGAVLHGQAPAPPQVPAKPAAAATPSSPSIVTFDRYHAPRDVDASLTSLNQANPGRTALHTLATSPGGLPVTAIEIGPDAGKKIHQQPAVFVMANLEGIYPIATEAALSLATRLLANAAATKSLTWYIVPNANPDAARRYFQKPLLADERNARPYNDDMDDAVDEDGPDDLDGNGLITQMRVKDPAGEWMPVDGDPRLMRKADSSKGEKGLYKLLTEGIDNDRDGDYNEDGPGGTSIGITFPHLFHSWTATAGRWPGSEPETFGVMKFVIDRPEIAMTFAFGATNMCLQPPAGGRSGSFDANAVKIPERIAPRIGADPNRTYSMKEIIEMVRPMAPPGYEITESMIASFLGLGAVVNPLDDDLKIYKELSEKYKEHLKNAKLDAKRLDPPQPKDGSFELWSYYHLGVPTFTMDLWSLPEAKSDEKEKTGITADTLEGMTPDAFVALGEAKLGAFLKEVGAPDNIKPTMLLDGVKSGKMTPKQMAGMLKQMPKPKDSAGADPKDKALAAFSDKELQGKGIVPWAAFKHPQLGDVEIGGAVPFADTTPPPAMLPALLDGQVPWVLTLADKLAKLRLGKSEVKARGAGVYSVTVWVENAGYLPFPTAMGQKNQHVAPAIVTVSTKDRLEGVTFLSGRSRTAVNAIDGGRAVKLEWLVHVPPTLTSLDIVLQSANAWGDTRSVGLAAGQGGVK